MRFRLPARRPAVMGILNVTPDSFSDGGLYLSSDAAIERGMQMVTEGADLVDVGGESTRPGALAVGESEELSRVMPVIGALVARGVAVSIDTSKSIVAKQALDAGACVVNDVTAGSDPKMAQVCAEADATVCLMHMQGEPRTMQIAPHYEEVVTEVRDYLVNRAQTFRSTFGVNDIWIDPGIGFGKTVEHNLALLSNLEVFVVTELPVLIGVSRKSFLGKILGGEYAPIPPEERIEAGIAAQVVAQMAGVKIIRTHDVVQTRRAVEVVARMVAASR